MPNWCNNSLSLSHPDKTMMDKAIEATKNGFLQTLIPCPEELTDTTKGYVGDPYQQRLLELKQQLNIEFLVFQSPMAEKLESEYLVDFFKSNLNSKNFLDFEIFGFVNWCHQQDFTPLDNLDRPEIGHYGADAHRAFAEQILIPHLEKYERRY